MEWLGDLAEFGQFLEPVKRKKERNLQSYPEPTQVFQGEKPKAFRV